MERQLDMFEQSRQAAVDGMNRVIENSPPTDNELISDAIRRCAFQMCHFTSDDVWAQLEEQDITAHPNVMGALFGAAAKKGLIRDSGKRTRTHRVSGHARKITLWRSLLRA